VSEAQGKSSCS